MLGGLAASILAASSWAAGAVPVSFRTHPPGLVERIGVGGGASLALFYVGLVVAVLAWVALGRLVLADPAVPARRMAITVAVWAAPLLLAQPFGSRDLWSYAAQGHLAAAGLDPYLATPADRPGNFLANVSPVWVHAPSPYGPLWTLVSRAVVNLSGNDAGRSAVLLRVPAALGLALLVAGSADLCARLGIRSDRALWAAAANPLTLALTLGGGHNDLLMVGLMVTGVAVVVQPGTTPRTLVPAAALVTAAAAVKSPAFVGLAFLVPLWLATRPSNRVAAAAVGPRGSVNRIVRAAAAVLVTAIVVFAALTAIEGHGLGWADQVSTRAVAVNWLSVPTAAAMIADVVRGHPSGATTVDAAMAQWRTGGLGLAAIVLTALWVQATARAGRPSSRSRLRTWAHRTRLDGPPGTLRLLGLAFLALIVLSPAVQPWYLLWALPWFAASGIGRRAAAIVTGTSVALVFMVRPKGTGVIMSPVVILVLAAAAMAGALAHRWWAADAGGDSGPADDHSDSARPGVRADRRADL
ncbi:MAG: polyprenol phosphomannose-dependent alpha 1,6 mannosyltransferase MptB [bacterium]